MKAETGAVPERGADQREERPDLAAWRRRHALGQSSAAQPVRNERKYRRGAKHRDRSLDS